MPNDYAVRQAEEGERQAMREYLQKRIELSECGDSVPIELLSFEPLQGPALGIAKQVLERGLESLSQLQRQIFDCYIDPPCKFSGGEMTWDWRLYGDDPTICDYCDHMLDKD